MEAQVSTPPLPSSTLGREGPVSQVSELIQRFSQISIFREAVTEEMLIERNPFRRPMRENDHRFIDFTQRLSPDTLGSNQSLAAHRLLFNVYETDLLFLPHPSVPDQWQDMRAFYGDDTKVLAERIRPCLEECAFGFLKSDVEVTGIWDAAALEAYFSDFEDRVTHETSHVLSALQSIPLREECAKFYLIQLACDFLTEASAMARNVLGNVSPVTSELFKILIDEYGAGVVDAKHSTLFERTLQSVGLAIEPHTYWQFYLPTSLMLANYFHYISRNHSHFLRYLGALYFTETELIHVTKQQSNVLHAIFGERFDAQYFDEHTHIDEHHGRMARTKLIGSALDQYGGDVIREILRGFEEFRLLERLADTCLMTQLNWAGRRELYRNAAQELLPHCRGQSSAVPCETFIESEGERSTTHVHDDNRLLYIQSGTMDFWSGVGDLMKFGPGESMLIPKYCLHGSAVTSGSCVYDQYLIPDERMPHST